MKTAGEPGGFFEQRNFAFFQLRHQQKAYLPKLPPGVLKMLIDFGKWSWLLPWLFALSLVVFIGSIIGVWIVLVRLPEDYLTHERHFESNLFKLDIGHLVNVIVRNVAGFTFLGVGIVMLLTPGQGILSIIVGVTLIDFPGKRKLILKILSQPKVLNAINKLRKKAHKPPLLTSDSSPNGGSTEQKPTTADRAR